MRLPTYKELHKFVEVEGWVNKDSASKKKTGDHFRFTFVTQDGESLYIYISHGRGQIQNPKLFAHILWGELKVSSDQFWAAVDHGDIPRRTSQSENSSMIEYRLMSNLLKIAGVSPTKLERISQVEAEKLWGQWLKKHPPATGGLSSL